MNIRTSMLALALAPALAAQSQSLYVVSLGDSYASGEGNPNAGSGLNAVWSNNECHRSVNNGRRFAANRMNAMTGVSVLFVDFACSGATVEQLISGGTSSQPGMTNVPVPAQIEAARTDQLQRQNRPIDILMISIGGNDAGFASVVKECLLPNDCRNSSVVQSAINSLGGLPARLRQLRARIADRLVARHVYITEYPSPLRNNNGEWCGDFDDFVVPSGDWAGALMKGIAAAESEFLHNNFVVPLNDTIRNFVQETASQQANWHYVAGPQDTFRPHGFCQANPLRWVHTLGDSFANQGSYTGAVHPNVRGHEAYADALVRRATFDFNLPLESPKIQDIDAVNKNAEWNLVAAPWTTKRVRAEINQVPGSLTVTLQSRIRRPFDGDGPAWTNTSMSDGATGALNRFFADVPGSETVWSPADWIEYRVRVTQTRNGVSRTTTSAIRRIVVGQTMLSAAELLLF
jgi:lysophospholipase L1-like esterase